MDILEKFDPEAESIGTYLERADNYFSAHDIAADRQVAVFLNAIGRETYSLLKNLLAPRKLADQTLPELKQALKGHFEPKKVVIAERFHFYNRNQAKGETISEYVAELRRLATHCNFKADILNDALRDKFVCGIQREATQRRLLLEATLTLEKAVKLAKGFEAVDHETKRLHRQGNSSEPIHAVKQRGHRGKKVETTCY